MILIKDMEMPEFCHKCYMSKMMGIVRDMENKSKNEKWVYCDLTKQHFKEYNLMKDEYPPRPKSCPLVEVEPFGVTGLLYKERI